MGQDNPRYDQFKFALKTQVEHGQIWLKLPATFMLDDPEQYFLQDVMARNLRSKGRAIWSMVWKSRQQGPPRTNKVGEQPSLPPGRLDQVPGEEVAAYPSTDHQPKAASGKFICWGFGTWAGCNKTTCAHEHQTMGKWDLLDYSFQ
eukprot:6744251-Heterocapsa_arctica.AAC.1